MEGQSLNSALMLMTMNPYPIIIYFYSIVMIRHSGMFFSWEISIVNAGDVPSIQPSSSEEVVKGVCLPVTVEK